MKKLKESNTDENRKLLWLIFTYKLKYNDLKVIDSSTTE